MQTARVDLSKIDSTYIFNVMQEDTDRQIRIELFDDGELYEVSGDTVSVWYEGSSGDAGNFSEGIVKEANALVITLDEHMTKNPGKYTLAVMLTRVGGNISTWNMVVNVSPLPGRSRSAAEEYFGAFSLTSLASDLNALNTRVDNIIANAGDTGNNAELVDIRLGYDGTTYPTAGDAVREQAKDSNNKLSIFNLTNDKFTIDGYINCTNGATANKPTGYVITDYIGVLQGSYIYVTNPKIWYGTMGMAFYDHAKKYISGIDINAFSGNTYGIFEVPSNAEYFRASSQKGNENAVVIFGVKSDLADVKNDLTGVKKEIDKKLDKKLGTNLLDPTKFRYGYYYVPGGNKITGDGTNRSYGMTDFIPVNGKNLVTKNAGRSTQGLSTYVVYDENKLFIRSYAEADTTSDTLYHYEFQDGDYYVTFIFYRPRATDPSSEWAKQLAVLYGDEYTYEEYTDYEPLKEIESRVSSLEAAISDLTGVKKEIDKKLDKKLGTNLLDPTKFRYGYYYVPGGNKITGDGTNRSYGMTDFIPVNGKNLVTKNAGRSTQGLSTYVVYDENKLFIRSYAEADTTSDTLYHYEFQDGDYYVTFIFYRPRATDPSSEWAKQLAVLYGDEYTYEEYTDYEPLKEIESRVSSLEAAIGESSLTPIELYATSPIYSVLNSIDKSRNYAQEYGIDHLIYNNSEQNKDIGFTEYMNDHLIIAPPLSSEMTEDTEESAIQLDIKSSYFDTSSYSNKQQIVRYVKETFGQDKFPKVLVIGDSVTDGYLANYQKKGSNPNQYWAWTKWYFEMDRINDFASNPDKSNYLTIGVTNPYGTSSSFSIGDSSYKAYAVGKGGWSASDLFLPYFENEDNINPFYDPDSETFSLKYFVDNYKTLNDDGKTRLSVGSTAGPLVDDVTKWDVCTPTHVVINLNHNSSLSEYQTNITNVVNKIKQEYPNMIIILMSIDETGTYFPNKYSDYYVNSLGKNGLHDKNLTIYKWIRENLENESNKIYVCSGNLIQPTVFSYPSIEMELSYSAGNASNLYNSKSDGGGPHFHPNNRAHSAWGYQLYALIKWTLKDL